MNGFTPTPRYRRLHAVVILVFTLAFGLHEAGMRGRLPGPFLHRVLSPLRRVSAFFTDLKFRLRGRESARAPIVIVEIDSPSIEAMGRWPWRRDYVAVLIDQVFALGAKDVGLDLIFSEPENRVPDELAETLSSNGLSALVEKYATDPKLAHVIDKHRQRLVLAWTSESPCQPLMSSPAACPVTSLEALASLPIDFSRFALTRLTTLKPIVPDRTPILSAATIIPNFEPFNDSAIHQGFANSFRDPDGIIRRASLVLMVDGKPHPSLALAMAQVALDDEAEIALDDRSRIESLRFGRSGRDIPVTPTGMVDINFRGPEHTFAYVSARDVFESVEAAEEKKPLPKPVALLDKAHVLIGMSAAALADITATPFDPSLPGVEAHATILDNLLSSDPLITSAAERHPVLVFLLIALLMTAGVSAFSALAWSLEALPAIGLLAATLAAFFLVDAKLLFGIERNWNTGFLYFEMMAATLLTLLEKSLAQERVKKQAEAALVEKEKQLLIESMANLRMESELKTAQLVQTTLLTAPEIVSPYVELMHYYLPASECGGDLWDAHLDGNRLRVLIGDATGHGAPAAIVTAVAKSSLATLRTVAQDASLTPDRCLTLLNRIIHGACQGKLLMTMSYIQLELDTGECLIASAGHEPPLCLRARPTGVAGKTSTHRAEVFFARGERLGYAPDSTYTSRKFQLEPGDRILLFTDGVSEARNPQGEEWGDRRLRRTFERSANHRLRAVRDELVAAVNAHTGGAAQKDDVTFLIIEWLGASARAAMMGE